MTVAHLAPRPKTTTTTTTDHHDQTFTGVLNTKQAADYLGVSEGQMEKWRHLGGGPDYLKYGRRCIRYTTARLDAFKERCRQEG